MSAPFVVIRRTPYEEPYALNLEIRAGNGTFSGATDFFIDTAELRNLGEGLRRFPRRAPDEIVYQYGSEDPADRRHRYFRLRAYTIDAVGHCALQLAMNLNAREPGEGACRFSIPAEAAELNHLGELMMRFAELRHLELRWMRGLERGELFEDYQP
jgi:hypothetical protein